MILNQVGYFNDIDKGKTSQALLARGSFYPKEKVLSYLKSGIELYSWLEHVRCLYSCTDNNIGSTEYTDGYWVWTKELIHYVEDHDIDLPPSFITYIQDKGYIIDDNENFLKISKCKQDPTELGAHISYASALWQEWISLKRTNPNSAKASPPKEKHRRVKRKKFDIPDDW